jgi:hypothetical protein
MRRKAERAQIQAAIAKLCGYTEPVSRHVRAYVRIGDTPLWRLDGRPKYPARDGYYRPTRHDVGAEPPADATHWVVL